MSLTYREALAIVVGTGSRGIKVGLERTEALLAAAGNPERGLRGVLVAGTNGKGSVCAMVESACRTAGLRTALLTKPHLTSYRERIVLDGRPIGGTRFAELVEELQPALVRVEAETGAPTQFEILTVLGVMAARAHAADVVVCEVGLGGRLDSTNVLDLGVAAITQIALDHREFLGTTVAEIAAEKAGILKPGNDLVTSATDPALGVILARAAEIGVRRVLRPGAGIDLEAASLARLGIEVDILVDRLPPASRLHVATRVPLPGLFQAENAGVAAGVCAALADRGLPLGDLATSRGFNTVEWRARLQWVDGDPPLLVDGAHNPAAVTAIVPAVRELVGDRPLVALVGCMADKDVGDIIEALRALQPLIPVFTQAGSPRAARAVDLARVWGPGARAIGTLPDAVTAARMLAGERGVVLVCGSLYLAGDVLALVSGPGE